MIILHFHLQPQFKNELFSYILHINKHIGIKQGWSFKKHEAVTAEHRQTIRTVRGIMMSHMTCDLTHLLYFIMPALGLIQVIGRNAS